MRKYPTSLGQAERLCRRNSPTDWAGAQTHFYERRNLNMKNKHINFRVTEKEKIQIEKLAKKSKLSQTDFIKNSVFSKEIIVLDGLLEVQKELKKIGNNLNQLTTRANMGHFNTVNLAETKEDFTQIHELLTDIYCAKIEKMTPYTGLKWEDMSEEDKARWTLKY